MKNSNRSSAAIRQAQVQALLASVPHGFNVPANLAFGDFNLGPANQGDLLENPFVSEYERIAGMGHPIAFVEVDEVAAINRSLERHGDVEIAAEDLEPVVEVDEVAAINRSLERLGDVEIAAEDLEPVVEVDVAAINRSLERLGESVDNAYFEPDADRIVVISDHHSSSGRAVIVSAHLDSVDGDVNANGGFGDYYDRMFAGMRAVGVDLQLPHGGELNPGLGEFNAYSQRLMESFAGDDGHLARQNRLFWGIDLDPQPAAAPYSADYNRRFWDGEGINGDGFDDLGDDERDAINRSLGAIGEEI